MIDTYIKILVAAAVTIGIRIVPIILIRKKFTNKYVLTFLYYVPYVTLAVMTVPSIYMACNNPIAGLIALIVGVVVSWIGWGLFPVATACCLTVLFFEFLL